MTAKNKKMLMFLLPLVVFGLLILMFIFRLGRPTDVVIATAMNKPLPAMSLPLLSDPNRTMTNADLPKTPFILNVWGSWCPSCVIEHPFLMELSAQGVPMVGVNYKDELTDALAYLNQHKDPFVYSVQDLDGKYALDLGLTGAPESFVVDGQGVVYKHIVGVIDENNWSKDIKPCLEALANPSLDDTKKSELCQ